MRGSNPTSSFIVWRRMNSVARRAHNEVVGSNPAPCFWLGSSVEVEQWIEAHVSAVRLSRAIFQ